MSTRRRDFLKDTVGGIHACGNQGQNSQRKSPRKRVRQLGFGAENLLESQKMMKYLKNTYDSDKIA